MERIAFTGNKGLLTRTLNNDATAYVGEPVKWVGLISIDVSFDLPSTPFPDDDIPDALVVNGTPSGSGTITLRGIHIDDYTNLVSAIKNTTGTRIRFGEDLPPLRFSFSANESSVVNDMELKHIFYNCRMTSIPAFSSSTKTEGEPTLRDIAIPITLTPLFYNDKKNRAIYDIVTSEDVDFNNLEDTIVFPTLLI